MSADKAKELGLKPMAKMINMCSAGVEPKYMGIGPAYAIPKCLKGVSMDFNDVDYWEINEAFAAQFLGVGRKLQEEHGGRSTWKRPTSTAPASPWATPSAAPACGSSSPCSMKWSAAASPWAAPPCAWAAALHGLPVDQGHLIPPPMVSDPTGALHPLVELPKMPAASAAGIFRPAPPPPCNLARERLQ